MGVVREFPVRGENRKKKLQEDIKLEKEIREVMEMARKVFTPEFMRNANYVFSGAAYADKQKKRRQYLRELQELEDLIGGKHQIIDIRGV